MARRPAEVSWWQNSEFLWLEFHVQSINGQSMKITNNPITGASNIKFKTDSDMNTLLLSKKVDLKKFTCMDETADSLVFQLTKKSKGFWDKISAENYSWLKLHEENQSQFENPKPKKPTQDQKSNQTKQPSDDYNKNEEIRKFKQMFGQQFRRYATDPNEAEVFEEMMAEITKNGYFDREAVQSRRNRERLNSNGYDDYEPLDHMSEYPDQRHPEIVQAVEKGDMDKLRELVEHAQSLPDFKGEMFTGRAQILDTSRRSQNKVLKEHFKHKGQALNASRIRIEVVEKYGYDKTWNWYSTFENQIEIYF